jgi:hypothetical protein
MTEVKSFGEMNFGNAQLGDMRRTRRLVTRVGQLCARPGGTLPQVELDLARSLTTRWR